jgi:hypothetical protein
MEHFVPIRYPTPESANSVPHRPDYQQGSVHFDNAEPEPPKKRQKRNKPTLSCEECVGRKTKVCHNIYISYELSSFPLKSGRETRSFATIRLARLYLQMQRRHSIFLELCIYKNSSMLAFMDCRYKLDDLISLYKCVRCLPWDSILVTTCGGDMLLLIYRFTAVETISAQVC